MNTGLQDAINLGWKLGLACRGRARSELLDTYEVERLPVIKRVLSGADVATRAVTVRDAAGQQAVTQLARMLLGFEPVRDYLIRNISEVETNYRSGGCVSSFRTEHAGGEVSRLLQVTMRDLHPIWRRSPKAGPCGCTT